LLTTIWWKRESKSQRSVFFERWKWIYVFKWLEL